jgi:hypothetical protein
MWIDMNAPGRGTFDADLLNGYDQYTRRKELADKYGNAGVDWRKELADYASYLKGKGEICPAMPEKVTSAKHKAVKMKRWLKIFRICYQRKQDFGKMWKWLMV